MKKSKKQQLKYRFAWKPTLKVTAVILGLLLLAAQLAYDKVLWRQDTHFADRELLGMISDSIQSLSKEAVVDGPSRHVYIPEARLLLPPYPKDILDIRYGYSPANEGVNDEEIRITTNAVLGTSLSAMRSGRNLQEIFDKVPKAQACSRQFMMTFKDSYGNTGDSYDKVATQQLADGRTVYLYLDSGCKDQSEPLLNYLKQTQSY